MTKVLDAFLFTHEFDLLELRLRTLWPVVDRFFLMEGAFNFANKPKPMRFQEQAERFHWAKDKLCIYRHLPPFIDGPGELFIEHQHRQTLYDKAHTIEGFGDDDILLLSDVDELPSREVVEKLKAESFPEPLLLHQDFYYYNIKCHRGKRWHGTMAMHMGYDLGKVSDARAARPAMQYINKQCGWHLAHFYDAEGIREKLRHSSHQHYNQDHYADPEHIRQCIAENKNYLGKRDGDLEPESLPDYLLQEMQRFPFMLGEEWK